MEQIAVLWRNDDFSQESIIGVYDDFEKALGAILFDSLKLLKDDGSFENYTMSIDARRDEDTDFIEIAVTYTADEQLGIDGDKIYDYYRMFSTGEYKFEELSKYGI